MDATFLQACPNQWIRISTNEQRNDERIDDERREKHTAHQEQQQLAIDGENLHAAFRHRREHKAKDSERRELDDPTHNCRDGLGEIRYSIQCGLRSQLFERQTDDDSPEEHSQIVGIRYSHHRIGYHIRQQVRKHIDKGSWGRIRGSTFLQHHRNGEKETAHHSHDGRNHSRHQIEGDDSAETRSKTTIRLSYRTGHQHGNQDGSNSLQRSNKQLTENGNTSPLRKKQAQDGAQHESDHDAQHQARFGVLFYNAHIFIFITNYRNNEILERLLFR